MSEWVKMAADPAPAPADAPAADQAQKPLPELDKQRQPPPTNPTGIPDQKPMPLSELLRLLEAAGKSLLDAGMDLEKGSANVQKVRTMGGASESERQIMDKAGELAKKISSIQQAAKDLASEISAFREGLVGKAPDARGSKGWWAKK